MKGRNIGGAEKGEEDDRTQQHIRDLHSRIVSLENDFQLSQLEMSQIQEKEKNTQTQFLSDILNDRHSHIVYSIS